MRRKALLTVVGTGMSAAAQLTPEARGCIVRSARVFYLVADPLSEAVIRGLNGAAESLMPLYRDGAPRGQTYARMVRRILSALRQGADVCAVFYGHPGVFVGPSHEAIRKARKAGCAARMLPGISAEDNLFADLGIDPATSGCQSYEATDFLVRPRRWDTASGLVLWQIGCIGDPVFRAEGRARPNRLDVLRDALARRYPRTHRVVVYEGSALPIVSHRQEWVALEDLPSLEVSYASTLYVPPANAARVSAAVARRLGTASRLS